MKILEQPIDEIKRFVNLRRRINEFRVRYNLPDPIIPYSDSESESEPEHIMAEGPQNRPLKFYVVPSQAEPHNSIAAPAINRNDFELKPSLIPAVQQNQFSGNATDDPNLHLSIFVQYADTVKVNGVS